MEFLDYVNILGFNHSKLLTNPLGSSPVRRHPRKLQLVGTEPGMGTTKPCVRTQVLRNIVKRGNDFLKMETQNKTSIPKRITPVPLISIKRLDRVKLLYVGHVQKSVNS